MKRFVEKYDTYSVQRIGSTDVVTFERHNMALPVWGAMSTIMRTPLNLISCDYHTDTHKPFSAKVCCNDSEGMRNYSLEHPIIKETLNGKKYTMDNFLFDDVYSVAKDDLKNDEQILTAVSFDYIRSYTIICNEDPLNLEQYTRQDVFDGHKATYVSKWKLPMKLLISSPIVLDFDLDFLNSERDFTDEFIGLISPIINRAELITIAREPYFFEFCRVDKEYSIDRAYNQLIKLITDCIS